MYPTLLEGPTQTLPGWGQRGPGGPSAGSAQAHWGLAWGIMHNVHSGHRFQWGSVGPGAVGQKGTGSEDACPLSPSLPPTSQPQLLAAHPGILGTRFPCVGQKVGPCWGDHEGMRKDRQLCPNS